MRPSRTEALIQTAFVWAQRGTCSRLQVGALVHREGRILVQGYNGAPASLPHCPVRDHVEGGHNVSECRAVHAEQNAIAYAARVGVALEAAELVCTHQPCLSCSQSIINAGIVSVIYVFPYRLDAGLILLNEAGLKVTRMVD